MNRFALFSLSLLCSVTAQAYQIDKTVDVDPKGRVDIKNIPGEVTVKGWERPEIFVKGSLDDEITDFIFEVQGKVTTIKVKDKHYKDADHEQFKGALTIMLPHTSDVDVEGVNCDLNVSGVSNKLEVGLVNGDVIAKAIAGNTELNTVNGNINVSDISGDAEFASINGKITAVESNINSATYSTVNGDMLVESTAHRLIVETVNGDVELKALSVEDLELNSVNGEVEADLVLVGEQPRVVAASVSGDISLVLDKAISATFSLEAHVGGDIENKLTSHRPEKDRIGLSEELAFQLGDGDVKIDMTTVSGDLVIKGK